MFAISKKVGIYKKISYKRVFDALKFDLTLKPFIYKNI